MEPELTDAQIIDALGGVGAVADALGKKYTAVHNWRNMGNRGIPKDFDVRTKIARLALEKGVVLPRGRFPVVEAAA